MTRRGGGARRGILMCLKSLDLRIGLSEINLVVDDYGVLWRPHFMMGTSHSNQPIYCLEGGLYRLNLVGTGGFPGRNICPGQVFGLSKWNWSGGRSRGASYKSLRYGSF